MRGGLAQQLQGRQRDDEQLRRDRFPEPERCLQGGALPRRQLAEITQHRAQQLVQPSEREVRLRLHPRHAQHHHAPVRRGLGGLRQQRRLPDTRLPAQHQRRAPPTHVIQQAREHAALMVAPD